jgi:hypothetical protein
LFESQPGAGVHSNHLPIQVEGAHMSKGMNQKKEQRKKPAKTLEEKRAAKKAKREERASNRSI